jgi:hypothetical protein
MEVREENPADWPGRFEHDGFAVLSRVFDESLISDLAHDLDCANDSHSSVRQRQNRTYAIRNLLESIPAVRHLADSPVVRSLVEPILGTDAIAVRGLLFDKTPEANWKVAWHQDLTIAVQHRASVPDFGPWSVKAGVQHVQPPVPVLEAMMTLRLHLDDCGEENGPLQVLPGSHRAGKLSADEILAWRARGPSVACTVQRGGVLLMRPLLLHASSAAKKPGHRRVIHLEFTSAILPPSLAWAANESFTKPGRGL